MWNLVDFKRVVPASVDCYTTLHQTEYVIAQIDKVEIKVVTQTIKAFNNDRKYTEQYYLVDNYIWFKAQEALNFAIALNAGLGTTEATYYVDFTSRMLKGDVK